MAYGKGYQNHSRPAVGKKRASLPLQMCQGGGLEENDRAVNQLLAIVRSENTIGQEENWYIIICIENGD